MHDLAYRVSQLKRPKLLVKAAQLASSSYKREQQLTSLIGHTNMPSVGEAICLLLDLERETNERRLDQDAFYSHAKHIQLLAAIMTETAMLHQNRARPDLKST